MRDTILHVFNETYNQRQNKYLGATKDIRSRTQYFEDRHFFFVEFRIAGKRRTNFAGDLRKLPDKIWKRCRAVILEMTYSATAIGIIRRRAPSAVVMVRSHNAELFHRFHWAWAQKMSKPAVRSIAHSLKNALLDFMAGVRADYILSISQWEIDNYWKFIAPPKKISYVPFYLPRIYASELEHPIAKENLCIHFGASTLNPLIKDASYNFIRMVKTLGDGLPEWQFSVTGDFHAGATERSARVRYLGSLDKPYSVLQRSKAIAILSNLGFGFKTKILEAIMAKNFVILPDDLYQRIPGELQPYCIPIDLKSSDSFIGALEKCSRRYPPGDPNADFSRRAFEALDLILATNAV